MTTTKFKISRSRVMGYAWEMKKGKMGWAFTFSECLAKAWKVEKIRVERQNDDYDSKFGLGRFSAKNIEELKASTIKGNGNFTHLLANTLTDYYANDMYNGD